MSRIIQRTGTWTGVPAQWLGVWGSYGGTNNGWSTSYPYTNCYTNSSSNTFGQIVPPASTSTNNCVQRFGFNITGIPNNATITSLSCTIKIACSNGSGFSIATAQFYNGDMSTGSAKGTALDFTNNTSTTARIYNTLGSWTKSELDTLELRITSKKSGNSTRYVNFYGADLTINYSYNETEYEITTSTQSATATISPVSQYIVEGNSGTVTISNVSDITELLISDNDEGKTSSVVHVSGTTYTYTIDDIDEDHNIVLIDVPSVYLTVTNNSALVTRIDPTSESVVKTAQGSGVNIKIFTDEIDHINIFDDNVKNNDVSYEYEIESGSDTFVPSSNQNTSFSTWSSASNGHTGTSSTSRTNFQASTSTVQYGDYFFNLSSIPSDATILSVACRVKICVSNTYSRGSGVQLFSGSTFKSRMNTSWLSNKTATVYTLANIEDFTRAELDTVSVRIFGKSGGSGRSIYFYGADLDIEYEYLGEHYWLYTATVDYNKTVRIETRPQYQVTASSQSSGDTISPASISVWEGHDQSFSLSISDLSAVDVTDNETSVKSQLSGISSPYTYTLSNITESHIIVIKVLSQNIVYVKVNGAYVRASRVYQKVSGSWQASSDITSLFTDGKIYVSRE